MRNVMLVLLLITSIVGCGSDKVTNPFVPIDPANLIGTWEGSYALTYDAGTDSAQTYEVAVQIVFADTSFTFTGERILTCGTYGSGKYQVEGKVLEFEDQTLRTMFCDWANMLHGQFTYNYDGPSPALELHMTQGSGRYSWQVDVVKVPEIVN